MVIFKGRIIDGNDGEVIEKGVVVVENDQIKIVCQETEFTMPENLDNVKIIEKDDCTILPGFIDCHIHLNSIGMNPIRLFLKNKYTLLMEGISDAKKMLDAGFTSAREMSEFGPYLKSAIESGLIAGPKLFVSGKLLSSTSGHGDACSYLPYNYTQEKNTIAYLVDGIDECIKGTRMNFREGADFIKTCSTGGILSSGDEPDACEFSYEELKAMVDEAQRHNTYVASHSQGNKGIYEALKAGIKSIEHGIFLDERCIELMVKNNCMYVPTLSILKIVCVNPNEVPEYAYKKAMLAIEGHNKSVELARKAGILIGLGSDFLGGDSKTTEYGTQGIEFSSLVEAGLTPMEAIMAGTKNASSIIKKSKEVGTIEADKKADIVLVDGNPLNNIKILADKNNVKVVMQNGNIVKNNL